MGNIVDSADIISLFEDKVSITQYITYESMSFDIDLQYAFHIHEFDIIDEQEARMDEEDSMIRYEHQTTKKIDRIHDQLEKNIIHRNQEDREDHEIAKVTREYSLISVDDPYEEGNGNEEKEKFRSLEEEEDSMTEYRCVVYIHSVKGKRMYIDSFFMAWSRAW